MAMNIGATEELKKFVNEQMNDAFNGYMLVTYDAHGRLAVMANGDVVILSALAMTAQRFTHKVMDGEIRMDGPPGPPNLRPVT